MKNRFYIFAFILFLSLSNKASSQNEGRLEDLYLSGTYKGVCPIEILDHVTISQCELCSFVTDSNDHSKGSVEEIEMTFKTDTLIIKKSGKLIAVPYTRDKDNHSFTFKLNDKQYNFRMFLYEEKKIIVDGDGMLVVLEGK